MSEMGYSNVLTFEGEKEKFSLQDISEADLKA